jgi:hypothetical protein
MYAAWTLVQPPPNQLLLGQLLETASPAVQVVVPYLSRECAWTENEPHIGVTPSACLCEQDVALTNTTTDR